MYERLLIVIAVAILGTAAFRLLRRLQLRRAQNAVTENKKLHLKAGTRHVIYFWSEHCPQCKNAQTPTLDRLLERAGDADVELIALCVEDHEDLAKSWGVRTLPTTYVIDRQGKIAHVNNGLASESRLLQQLELVTN